MSAKQLARVTSRRLCTSRRTACQESETPQLEGSQFGIPDACLSQSSMKYENGPELVLRSSLTDNGFPLFTDHTRVQENIHNYCPIHLMETNIPDPPKRVRKQDCHPYNVKHTSTDDHERCFQTPHSRPQRKKGKPRIRNAVTSCSSVQSSSTAWQSTSARHTSSIAHGDRLMRMIQCLYAGI